MDNNFDFESDYTTSNGPIQNEPVKNNEPINNGSNNGKNSGGVPLIAIIGIMALIILGLIIYIIIEPSLTSKENIDNLENNEMNMYEYELEEDIEEEENIEEDEENTTLSNKTNKDSLNENTVKNEDDDEVADRINEDEREENNENINTNDNVINVNDASSNSKLSDDWKDSEFVIAGQKYTLNTDYKNFTNNGWSVDFAKLGYEDGYILNKNDKTYSTTNLENEEYSDADVNIGFINLGEKAVDVTESQFWAISVDNTYTDTPVDFELPGGIKYGSTIEEVEAIYGKPEDEDDIYVSDSLGYVTYTYDNDMEPILRLTIYNDGGVKAFDYKIY